MFSFVQRWGDFCSLTARHWGWNMAITVKPVQPLIGAEIEGIDLMSVTGDEIAELRAALLRYKVIFFRNQNLERAQHVALGEAFGELEVHPLSVHPDFPALLEIASNGDVSEGREAPAADHWHSDTTFRERPSMGSILKATVLPALGGDTVFSNTVAAYAGLPEELRQRIEGLDAWHDGLVSFERHLDTPEKREAFVTRHPPQRHPVVRIHPETGERLLFVNSGFTTAIADIDPDESVDLLRVLFDEVKRPEYQVRFTWQAGSIAFWDNRSTQHYGVADYSGYRCLERVTIMGDRPVGPKGE